jgi:hypothetical protein
MNSRLLNAILIGFLGAIAGSVMGVVAFGGGENGAYVFGPIGFILGWLLPVNSLQKTMPLETERIENEKIENVSDAAPSPKGDLRNVEASINEIIPIVGRILVSIWNMQMKFLIAVGLMDYFVQRPWLLFALAIILLAVFYPLGIVFSVTGIAAMNYGAKSENQFMVNASKSA